ncbi:hypothetical protein BOTBODRAFT_105793, partial [Botryobasidium botryosum FD-172 SS1]
MLEGDEEVRMFRWMMWKFEHVMATKPEERTFQSSDWFSDYEIPTVSHVPWTLKSIPIPFAIREEVNKLIMEKLGQGTYE